MREKHLMEKLEEFREHDLRPLPPFGGLAFQKRRLCQRRRAACTSRGAGRRNGDWPSRLPVSVQRHSWFALAPDHQASGDGRRLALLARSASTEWFFSSESNENMQNNVTP